MPSAVAGGIEAEGVVLVTRTGRRVLDGVDLAVEPGEVLGVVGPAGVRRRALVAVLGALATPTEGVVRLGGVDLGEDPATARRRVGAVLGEDGLDPVPTPREHLCL